jgi:hypothetical protein
VDAQVIQGLVLVVLGALVVLMNKRLGRLLSIWNTGFLISPSLGAKQYRSDARGRLWIIIVVGGVWVLVGLVLIVSALVS